MKRDRKSTKTVEKILTRIDVVVPRNSDQFLPEEIHDACPGGVWIEEHEDNDIIHAYPEKSDQFLRILQQSEIRIHHVVIEKEEIPDYVEMTKQFFKPIRIDDITILAPWNKTDRDGVRIIIDPGMAFGTGRHESTVTMLRLMKTIDIKGKRVLDLGCGSAILSLYAARLGAKRVYAVDNDFDAVMSARKNVLLNRTRKVKLICSSLKNISGRFDVVLANLDIQIFRQNHQHIATLVGENGTLVLSGILCRDRKDLPPLFPDLHMSQTRQKNSWCGFVFTAP